MNNNSKKFKRFNKFVENVNANIKNSQVKLKALKSYIESKPITIIKYDNEGNEIIDKDLIISSLPYDEMITNKEKELIGPKRYQAILFSFLEGLDHSLQMKQQAGLEWDNLFLKDIQDLFLDHVRTHYNIYASFPEALEPRE